MHGAKRGEPRALALLVIAKIMTAIAAATIDDLKTRGIPFDLRRRRPEDIRAGSHTCHLMAATPLSDRVRPGDTFSATHRFDAASIAEFAEKTGDRNPVHFDASAGAASRFGKRIASGQHIVSLMLGLASSWLAERGKSFGLGCSFRFTAAVLEGDSIDMRWSVIETVYKEILVGMIVVLEGTAANPTGRVCSRGRLEMLLQE